MTRAAPALASDGQAGACCWRLRRGLAEHSGAAQTALLAAAGLSGAVGLAFVLAGVTVMMAFTGLEIAVLGLAVWHIRRHAGDGDEIRWADGQLKLRRREGVRQWERQYLAPWVRTEWAPHGDGLWVKVPGHTLEVGRGARRAELAAVLTELPSAGTRMERRGQ